MWLIRDYFVPTMWLRFVAEDGQFRSAATTHQDEAWDYATYQSGPDGEKVMLQLNLTTPWRKSTLGGNEYAKYLQPWENVAYYTEALKATRPTVYPVKFDDIRKLYASAYDKVRAGQETATQAMTAIKGQINEFLKQGSK